MKTESKDPRLTEINRMWSRLTKWQKFMIYSRFRYGLFMTRLIRLAGKIFPFDPVFYRQQNDGVSGPDLPQSKTE